MPARQRIPKPVYRHLRTFAVDPGMTARFETALLNEMTLSIPWEPLKPGPVGEYIAVVDEDKEGRRLHDPVDLDDTALLAQDGLAPSDGNPQFHQQMVYAVSMRTIQNFERALGRLVHWPQRKAARGKRQSYKRQLNVYPHFTDDANAWFEPNKGFFCGQFVSPEESPFPGTRIFTCLSQDVIAHELTHGILTGMEIAFDLGAHPDVPAIHEAFCDLVALLQHFWKSDVLRAQIAGIRGDLEQRSTLGALALQFGQATGRPDGLRNPIGETDTNGVWQPRRPDPKAYLEREEPHQRGDILVAAVFGALRKIYESRVADLRRMATHGSGVLPTGSLHPDLVERFADEAARSATRVLEMCVRALDYIPPVELTFGDYLRAIITADVEYDTSDRRYQRVAFTEAFRSYGIFPVDVGTLSVDDLIWPGPASPKEAAFLAPFVQSLAGKHAGWNLPTDREKQWRTLQTVKEDLFQYLTGPARKEVKRIGPVDLTKDFSLLSFQPRGRPDLGTGAASQWVVKLGQQPSGQRRDKRVSDRQSWNGCTLVVDADTGMIRYIAESGAHSRRSSLRKLKHTAGSISLPAHRQLRVFAFDPALGIQSDTAMINEVTLSIPWERDAAGKDILERGPVGEYVEVIDRDPASGCFYSPVDLNNAHILAQHGLPCSESSPQFHQQMVYAVTMRTIRTFERALGRMALWSPRPPRAGSDEEYVQRLRIFPHALREANAYYSPSKKALLFGYFSDPTVDGQGRGTPMTVFTCLSHDVIAHETTHALLDGMHRRFREPSNRDVLAFHEAFADIVALFQHFSLAEVLRHQIAATRGDLASQNRLGELAQQFGQAIGNRGALRSAIGVVDEVTGQWKPLAPDPEAMQRANEPHERGALLVAAVFDAFLTMYKARVADLLRIASGGTGVLPAGQLHPDLVNRLADEAASVSSRVLDMCIRALDYCPPVDLTFGDYLRAVVTADFEYDPVDEPHRRTAFAEAFRRRGIIPEDVRTVSVDGLLWRPAADAPDENENVMLGMVRSWAADISSWSVSKSREELYNLTKRKRAALHEYLRRQFDGKQAIAGIDPTLPFEVHSIRPSLRADAQGKPQYQWIIELTQRIAQWIDPEHDKDAMADYYFRGGCTVLVEADTGKVRYTIRKRLDDTRKERQRAYFMETGNESLAATYFGGLAREDNEPFAVLHRY
jgi:hypothetical protein